jgi:hypothetical protein
VFFSVPAYWEKIARAINAHDDQREALRRVTGVACGSASRAALG